MRQGVACRGEFHELGERANLFTVSRRDTQAVVVDVRRWVRVGHGVVKSVDVTQRTESFVNALLEVKLVVAANAHDNAGLAAVGVQLWDAIRVAHPLAAVSSFP